MDENFEKLTDEMNKKYNEIKDFKERDRFYFDEFLPLYLKKFIEENKQELKKEYDILISLVGLSPATSILSGSLVKPKKGICLIFTEESSKYMNIILEKIEYEKEKISFHEVDEKNINDLYNKIIDIYLSNKEKRILIDLTGGKKTMSAIAGMISAVFNIDACYIDYRRYVRESNKPYFSSEFLKIINNPFYFSGDKVLLDVLNYFNSGNYNEACKLIEEYEEKTTFKKQYNIELIRLLSQAQKNWIDFNFEEAKKLYEKILNKFQELDNNLRSKLEINVNLLKKIKETEEYKIFNHYFLGIFYENKERYEISTFLLYRTIEMIFQSVLKKDYNFNTSKPDYSKIEINFEKFKEIAEEVFGEEYKGTGLPPKTALMDDVFILKLLRNDILRKEKNVDINWIFNCSKIRNYSNMAHGDKIIKKNEQEEIKRLAKFLILNYLKKYDLKILYEELEKSFELLKLNIEGLL
ncbi:MAG: hypothetical protein ABIN00_07960 [candidate division WOR-3 bacterium]